MASKASHNRPAQAGDVAGYVAAMAKELKVIVEPQQMPTLAYLLDLVRLEAESCAEKLRQGPPNGEG